MALPNAGNLTKKELLHAAIQVWSSWRADAQAETGDVKATPWFYFTTGPINLDPWGSLFGPLPVGTGITYLGKAVGDRPSLSEDEPAGTAVGKWPVYTLTQGLPFTVPVVAINYPLTYLGWFIYPEAFGVLGPDSDKVIAKGLLDNPVQLGLADIVSFRLTENVKNRLWP